VYTSEKLTPGAIYTRKELAVLFNVSARGAIDTGVFRPDRKRFESIWLFVTETKAPDRPQLIDKLEGDFLHWQGQPEQGTDRTIINHKNSKTELLVFYRKTKNEYPHGGFVYEGLFEYESHKPDSKPTDFLFVRKNSLAIIVANDISSFEIEHGYHEGGKQQYLSSRYERDPNARLAAVQTHGFACLACGFSFEETYGDHGKGFIQVHHIKPISSLGESTLIDPRIDMTVLCANCHCMIHRFPQKPLTVDELRALIGKPVR